MEIDGCHLPQEALDTWNDELPDSTEGTIHELTKAVQCFLLKKMKTKRQVQAVELETWLWKNGWMKERVRNTYHWRKGGLNAHKLWYIDFTIDPFRYSQLEFTKSVIFLNREESAPRIYWELRHFAKALNATNEKFNMYVWWCHQKRVYEELRAEFKFDELTLRPCRRAYVKLGSAVPTLCTKETILATNGLIVILLRSILHSKPRAKQTTAKAVLIDFLYRLLSEVKAEDEIWSSFTRGRLPKDTIKTKKIDDRSSGPEQDGDRHDSHHANVVERNSAAKAFAETMIDVFANRKKCESWKACFQDGLQMLEARITTVVLTGKVGQISPVVPSVTSEKRSMKLENPKRGAQELQSTEIQKCAVQFAESKKSKHHKVPCKPGEHTRSKDKPGRRLQTERNNQEVTQIPGTRP